MASPRLLKRIRGGADFAALAKQYSEDPSSKDNGGEMPKFPRGQMAPEFEAAAFSLTNNQVSDVITTAYGYHIIKLLDKTPAQRVDYATVAPKIKDFLTQQKTEKLAPAYLEKLGIDGDPSERIHDPLVPACLHTFRVYRIYPLHGLAQAFLSAEFPDGRHRLHAVAFPD